MSDDMNLDASSAHENCETGQISPPRQETSILKHEYVPRSLASKAIGEKPMISTENVNKGSIEARAGECNYDGIEQLGPLQEDLTKNSSLEQLGRRPECATQSSNSEQFECLSVQAAGEKLSAKQAMSDINHELVLESVNSEALVEKEKVGIDHIKDGPDETGTVEIDHLGLEPPENERNSSPEKLGVPPEDSAINTSLEESKPIPADVFQNSDLKQFETGTVEIDHCGHQSSGLPSEDIAKNSTWEQLKPPPEDERKSSPEQGVPPEDVGENPSLEQFKPLPDDVSKNCDLKHIGSGTIESDHNGLGIYGLPSKDKAQNSFCKQLMPPPEDEINSSPGQLGVPPEDVAVNPSREQLKPLPDNLSKNCVEQFELPPAVPASDPSKSGSRGRRTSAKSTKGKHGPRYSLGNTRLLRSRSQEKPKARKRSNNFAGHGDDADSEKSKKRKKKQIRKTPVDEFSRIRKHLRYLLHRITYEQNLIDAYSGEGWKGQSLEKLKPEKELQRAKSEIFRCKLKIRDLFQRLDLSIAEGRLPASLFDSEGQIDSEDIFCAKCGSMDLPADNDIILCDGACERGFHQFCLEPPLLKEDIPPDDEGWLCPGCDCKVDCIDLLNDSQGTKLSVLDTWERVFPEEAAAAAAGNKLDDNNLGLPSDNSEDSDYNPDASEGDEKVDGDESSSDKSDFYSASEDIGSSPKSKQKLEISSDDSEDDEYDPNAPELDEQVKEESSSSDFTSDSEDFSVALDDHRSPYENESVLDKPMSASFNHTKPGIGSDGESSKVDQRKKRSINDELLSLLQSGPGEGKSAPVSARRHVERLDYKKLYDDAYPNDSSDSSDENWMDAANAPKKRRKHNMEGSDAEDMNHDQEENERTPKRRIRKKLGTNNSTPIVYKASSEHGSSGTGAKKSTYRRLGEAATQGLLKSFRQNQYPERGKKENLAKELGITLHQVSKWFENARWSFRHSPHMKALVEGVPSNGTPSRTNPSEPADNSLTEESSRQRSKTQKIRKKSRTSENRESDHNLSTMETQNPSPPVELPKAEEQRKRGRPPKAQEGRRRGRPKSRKSAA